ncbi:MAG: Crp/Fnr family transcriptional regulator [Rhizobiales bacterium]|nr:Crp/Fnr family transcriptional regulator [Hyphomicrobiales bacterium]
MISLERLHVIAHWSRNLPPEDVERARRGIIEKSYTAGSYICHLGDRFDAWTGVIDGLVKLATSSDAGKAVTFAGLPSGAWFGEGTVLKSEPRRYDLVALRDTRMALMDAPTFFWLFENSVGFNRFLVRQLNERLGQFMGLVENDRMLDSPSRIARSLAFLFNPELHPAVGLELAISQEEIGLLSGLSRQVTNRSLKVLEEAGVIRVERGVVSIRSWADLIRYQPR